jgi:mono/diheme cytochrome c family protein
VKALLAIGGLAAATAGTMPVRAADGAAVFTQNCLMCHQSGAAGLPGQFPRLAGRLASISGAPAGRAYLIDVLTYGMAGMITVDDQAIIGLMPPFAQLSNEDVAGVLSYVQSLGEPTGGEPRDGQPPAAKIPPAFTAEEVRAGRAKTAKTATDVRTERHSLEEAKIVAP